MHNFTGRGTTGGDTVKDEETQPRLAYPLPEAARLLGVCARTVTRLADSGALSTIRIGRRRLVTRQALEKLVSARGA